MKQREERLQAILEHVAGGPEAGIDVEELVGWIGAEYGVSSSTAGGYLWDLRHRGAAMQLWGKIKTTGVGLDGQVKL